MTSLLAGQKQRGESPLEWRENPQQTQLQLERHLKVAPLARQHGEMQIKKHENCHACGGVFSRPGSVQRTYTLIGSFNWMNDLVPANEQGEGNALTATEQSLGFGQMATCPPSPC